MKSQKTTHDSQAMTTIGGLPVRRVQSDLELPFEQLGDYKILRRLGKGAMGEVYLAEDVRLDRLVAVKVLPAELASDQQFVERFMNEARSAAKLVHPHIVPIYRIGDDQGYHFFAMQFIEGESLDDLLKKETPLDEDRALQIIEQIASGLTEAHSQGLIHRDIKPANIMLDQNSGKAMLADFGIVKSSQSAMEATAVGVIMGTAQYISPEQGRGQQVDVRSDLYSLGATLYRMLAGQLPFEADNPSSMIYQHVHEKPKPIASINSEVSPQTVAIVERLLQKDPDQRYQNAQELVEDIQAIIAGSSTSLSSAAAAPKPLGYLIPGIAALSAIVLSLIAWSLFSGSDKSATKVSTAKTEISSSTEAANDTPKSPDPPSPRPALNPESPFQTGGSDKPGGRYRGEDGRVDYLPVIELDQDAEGKSWRYDGEKLILETPSPSHRLAVPMELTAGYEMDCLFTTQDGAFEIALPISSAGRALLRIGFNDGKGIELLGLGGEKNLSENEIPDSDPLLELNRDQTNRLQVSVKFGEAEEVRLQVIVNNTEVIDLKKNALDFSYTVPGAQHANGPVMMLIGNQGGQVKISSLGISYDGEWAKIIRPLNPARSDKEGQRGIAFDGLRTGPVVDARSFEFSGDHPLTLEAWVIPEEELKSGGNIVSLCSKSEVGMFNLRINRTSKWEVSGRDYDEDKATGIASERQVQWNKRTHIAGVLVDGQIELYVDGVKQSAAKMEEGLSPKGRSLRIGCNFYPHGDHSFKGKVEQVRVSNTQLYTEDFVPEKKLAAGEETMVLYDFKGTWGNLFPDLSGNDIIAIMKHGR